MPTSTHSYAFLVLLPDADDANGLARLLEDVRLSEPTCASVFLAPPTRGASFFTDDSQAEALDSWWGANIPREATPVYLILHEDGLPTALRGMDGSVYVGVNNPSDHSWYEESPNIHVFNYSSPLDFATAIMRDFSGQNGDGDQLFDEGEAQRMAALSTDFPLDVGETFEPVQSFPGASQPGGSIDDFDSDFQNATSPFGAPGQNPFGAPGGAPGGAPFGAPAGAPFGGGGFGAPATTADPFGRAPAARPAPRREPKAAPVAATPHPFDLLSDDRPPISVREQSRPTPEAPVPVPTPQRAEIPGWQPQQYAPQSAGKAPKFSIPGFGGLGGLFKTGGGAPRSNFTPMPDRQLADMLLKRGPTIVVMGSRKGGVGKTSYAAGVSIIGGTVLDQVGHKACIVDANIANPDAWGQMNLREGAATVRECVAALTANREPPPPVHASTPALACYPESREPTEYSKTDIRRFADYLRRRYTLIVVDMSNRLPDPMAGPEAAAAAYWLEHGDVLVLPTTSAKADFNGVLDYLDVRDLPPTIVPYIVPTSKQLRDNRVTQEYLRVIRERVQQIIDIPDDANVVRLAGMEGVPVEQLSPPLRLAYRELTEAVALTPPRARR